MTVTITNTICDKMGFKSKLRNFKDCAINSMIYNEYYDGDIDEKRIERTKAIILSMTKQERDMPSIIDSKRKRRIAAGSGTSVQEVNQLLKQFDQTKMIMKQLKGGKGKFRLPF